MGALLSAARGRRAAVSGLVFVTVLSALVRRATRGRLTRTPSKPHPKDDDESTTYCEPVGTYRTCLDRPYVQKEIGWAVDQKKMIIPIYDADTRRPGHFDIDRAVERYRGTKWERIFNLAAIPYGRGKHDEEAMLNKLFDRATGGSVKGRGKINPPYRWEFFLSHHQVGGGDQVSTLYHLLERKKLATWVDKYMVDQSEAAMEEGVRYSKYFLLFLTSIPTDASDVGNAEQPQPNSCNKEPEAGQQSAGPMADLAFLCKTQSASQRAKDRLRAYTDRPELRQRIVDWALRDDVPDHEHRCLVLGEPGSGKTTLLSQLTHEDNEFQSAVLAHHFCEAALEPTLRPSTFVQHIAKQLYVKAPEYKAHVNADRNLSDIVRRILQGPQEVERGVEWDKQRQPLIDLTEGVLEPLRAAYPGTARPQVGHVLVVDSLDEALLPFKGTTHTEGRSIVYLLKHCHVTGLFPAWMKVIATSRRDVPEVSQLRTWCRIDLMDHRTETETVFRAHINHKLQEPGSELLAHAGGPAAEPSPQGFFGCDTKSSQYFARLVTQADGIFQYLDTALNDIARGSTKLDEVPSLPGRLGELYGHFFERAFGDARSNDYTRVRPVFDAVAASDGGVPKTFLKNVLWLADPKANRREVTERYQSVGEFLKQIDDPEPATTVGRSSSAAPECARGHTMEKAPSEECMNRYCDVCRKTIDAGANSFRCDGCDYDICSECAHGSPLSCASSSGLIAENAERQTFYHHSLGEWFDEEQDYRVCKEDGHRALGVVQFAALAEKASPVVLDEFAKLCVEHLHFPGSLTGTHLAMLRNSAQDDGIHGDVYALMSHLGKALHFYCCDMGAFGKILVDAGIHVEEPCRWDGEWAHKRGVCHAAGKGDLEALRLFVAAQADLQCIAGDLSPLHWAVMKDQRAAINILAAGNGAGLEVPVNPAGLTPLHLAAQGRVECMRNLFACRVAGDVNAVDTMGMTALHIAAKGSFVNEIAELCDQAANVEEKEQIHEWTALHFAAQSGQFEAERVLIEKGADVNARSESKYQRTPLHLACARDSVDVSVSILCNAPSADLDARDVSGWTALHWACTKGHAQAVRELLAAKADATLMTNTGRTPLHLAARGSDGACAISEGAERTVMCLVRDFGANVHAVTGAGETPLQLAKDRRGMLEKALQSAQSEQSRQALGFQVQASTEMVETLRMLSMYPDHASDPDPGLSP